MTQDEMNAAVQSIISATRFNSETPMEGMHVLTSACYVFWRMHQGPNPSFQQWLNVTNELFKQLHEMNEVKGTA